MITYQYLCRESSCGESFSIKQSIKDRPLTVCPSCHDTSLQRIIHNPTIIDLTPKTVGGLADKNTSILSSQGKDEMWGLKDKKFADSKKAVREELARNLPKGASLPEIPTKPAAAGPFSYLSGPVDPTIAKMTPKEKAQYIMGGEE